MRAMRFGLFALFAMILTATISCQGIETGRTRAEPGSTVIRISGAGGTTGVLKGLAEEYSKANSDVSFKFLKGSGSGGGVKGVTADILDLGAMSRRPKESEFETGIEYISFAEERVAVVTSADLIIATLTVEQVRAIFTGEIDNWTYLGGPDSVIKLVTREEDNSNTKIMRAGILGDTPFGRSVVLMTSESDTKDALNTTTNAIGYLAYSGIVSSGLSVHPIALDGLHPGDTEGDYPLPSRSLGVAYLPERIQEVKGLMKTRSCA